MLLVTAKDTEARNSFTMPPVVLKILSQSSAASKSFIADARCGLPDEEIDNEGEQVYRVNDIQNDSRKSEAKTIAGNAEAKGGSECDRAIVKSNESDVVAKKKDRTDKRREYTYSSEDCSKQSTWSASEESDGNKKCTETGIERIGSIESTNENGKMTHEREGNEIDEQ